jgi:hypothetical protein
VHRDLGWGVLQRLAQVCRNIDGFPRSGRRVVPTREQATRHGPRSTRSGRQMGAPRRGTDRAAGPRALEWAPRSRLARSAWRPALTPPAQIGAADRPVLGAPRRQPPTGTP